MEPGLLILSPFCHLSPPPRNSVQKEGGTPGTRRDRTQRVLGFTSQDPSVPQFLSLEIEPIPLDILLAERLRVLEMIHCRALAISPSLLHPSHAVLAQPGQASATAEPLSVLSLCLQHHALFSQVSLMDECSGETGSGQALGSNIRWEGWGGSKGEQEGRELERAVPGAGERESQVKQ